MRKLIPLTLALLLAPVPAEGWTREWGEYRVSLTEEYPSESAADVGYLTERLVVSRGGETLVEITDEHISVSFPELTGQGAPELFVETYSGGAHCCFGYHVYTQDYGPLDNLIEGNWGSGGFREMKDLDGDGRDELVLIHIYEYLDGVCFACSPALLRVFAWEDFRFADVTKRLPAETRKLMREALSSLDSEGYGPYRFGHAATYWVNAVALGEGEAAWKLLSGRLEPHIMEKLKRNRVELMRPFSALPGTRMR